MISTFKKLKQKYFVMKLLYSFCFVFLGSNILSYKVEGLRVEKLVGGALADEKQFKYVVAIRYNPRENNLTAQNPCTGSIIDDWHIITVAHCFYDKRLGRYRNKEFYITVAAIDLWSPSQRSFNASVDLVIMPSFYSPIGPDNYSTIGNIAIVKIRMALGLHQGHRYLKKLYPARHLFVAKYETSVVAGFGWNQIAHIINVENGTVNNIQSGQADGKLRFANVNILDSYVCKNLVGSDLADGNMCAKIIQEPGNHKGICLGDSGGPLVRKYYLMGIAINGFKECNENQMPGIYINVPAYFSFIEHVLANNITDNMRVLQLQRRGTQFYFEEI